jgi:hypothetical protein
MCKWNYDTIGGDDLRSSLKCDAGSKMGQQSYNTNKRTYDKRFAQSVRTVSRA